MTRTKFVTHQNGSWKWQDRYALVEYRPEIRKQDGVLVWRSWRVLNNRVTPRMVSGPVGSLHNVPLSTEELAAYQAARNA